MFIWDLLLGCNFVSFNLAVSQHTIMYFQSRAIMSCHTYFLSSDRVLYDYYSLLSVKLNQIKWFFFVKHPCCNLINFCSKITSFRGKFNVQCLVIVHQCFYRISFLQDSFYLFDVHCDFWEMQFCVHQSCSKQTYFQSRAIMTSHIWFLSCDWVL